jgi:hypothetical protein
MTTIPTRRASALPWLIALAALAAAGCLKKRYRYVDLAAARYQALEAARTSAGEQGICPIGDLDRLVALVRVGQDPEPRWLPLQCNKLPPLSAVMETPVVATAARDPIPYGTTYTARTIELTAHDHAGGTRLELGDPHAPLDRSHRSAVPWKSPRRVNFRGRRANLEAARSKSRCCRDHCLFDASTIREANVEY